MEFLSETFEDDRTIDFDGEIPPFHELKRHYTDDDALGFAQFVQREKYYLDVHCTVWTPESFVDVFSRVIACLVNWTVNLLVHIDGFIGPWLRKSFWCISGRIKQPTKQLAFCRHRCSRRPWLVSMTACIGPLPWTFF